MIQDHQKEENRIHCIVSVTKVIEYDNTCGVIGDTNTHCIRNQRH